MTSAVQVFQELFARIAKIEKNIEILQNTQDLHLQVQAISDKLNSHIQTNSEVKKVTEQTLMMKTEHLVNKRVQDAITKALQKQNELTIFPDSPLIINVQQQETIAQSATTPVEIAQSATAQSATTPVETAQSATAPIHLSKKERKKAQAITLNLE